MQDNDNVTKVCEVCHQPITDGQGYVHHQRLDVDVHWDCPRDNVRGEDISLHAVFWVPPRTADMNHG